MVFHMAQEQPSHVPVPSLGDAGLTTHIVGPAVVIISTVNYFLDKIPLVVTTIAGILVIVLYSLQIWKDSSVQHALRNWRMKRKFRKIRKIKARQKVLIAQLEALEIVKQARIEAREKVEQATAEANHLLVVEEADEQIKSTPPK
jgi:hypothetical protein